MLGPLLGTEIDDIRIFNDARMRKDKIFDKLILDFYRFGLTNGPDILSHTNSYQVLTRVRFYGQLNR